MDIFFKNIQHFKRLFDFNDTDFEQITFQWILDGNQIDNITKKQNELKLLDKNEIINQIKSRDEKNKSIERLRSTEFENKCLVFQYANHQYQTIVYIGNIFDSHLLKNYSTFNK